ncbi:MAG: hypothetical protein P9L94_02600 [Candidatus Hinthialibacter antarcticus]|nr:hypothetical protein [Candidatus Hinthialibacter antarcticus]
MRQFVIPFLLLIFTSCSPQVEVGDEMLAKKITAEVERFKGLEYSVQYITTTYKHHNDLIAQRIQQAFERDAISNEDPDFEALYAQQVQEFAQNAYAITRQYRIIETKDYSIHSQRQLGNDPNWEPYQGLFNGKKMYSITDVCDKSLFSKTREFRRFQISYVSHDRSVIFQGDRFLRKDSELLYTIFPLRTLFWLRSAGSFKNKVNQMLKHAAFPADIETVIPREQALSFDINTNEKLPPQFLLCENNDERSVRQYASLYEGTVRSHIRWDGQLKVDGADYTAPQMMIHESYPRGLPQTTIVSVYSCRFGREPSWPESAMEFVKNEAGSSFRFGIEDQDNNYKITPMKRNEFFARFE